MYAPHGRRIVAFLMDFLLVGVLVTVVAPAFGVSLSDVGSPPFPAAYLIGAVVIFAAYHIAFIAWRGQTVGKMLMNIRVVDDTSGTLPTLSSATLRWLIPGAASASLSLTWIAWPIIYGWVLFDIKRQGVHDKVARTVVIDVLAPLGSDGEPDDAGDDTAQDA